jgi:hypothetical protein
VTAEKKPLEVTRIAGHGFVLGVCVTPKQTSDGHCGRHWADIRNCTAVDLNKPDIAHYGNLTSEELAQIERQRKVEDAAMADAMGNLLE